MTLHSHRQLKGEVGVRELHDQLSRYVRYVADGAEVFITIHGKRVARLGPVEPSGGLAALRERGLVRDPVASEWRPSGKTAEDVSVSDLIAAQRG
jgi:prevent-host-death family protein